MSKSNSSGYGIYIIIIIAIIVITMCNRQKKIINYIDDQQKNPRVEELRKQLED